jgi:hypothetical protein
MMAVCYWQYPQVETWSGVVRTVSILKWVVAAAQQVATDRQQQGRRTAAALYIQRVWRVRQCTTTSAHVPQTRCLPGNIHHKAAHTAQRCKHHLQGRTTLHNSTSQTSNDTIAEGLFIHQQQHS